MSDLSHRPEVESALRRSMRRQLEDHADLCGVPHLERDMLASHLQSLGLDELLVLDSLLKLAERRLYYRAQVWRLMTRLACRLVAGRTEYGELRMAADHRRWGDEFREEVLDALVYSALAQITGQREYSAHLLSLLMEVGGE